MSSFADDEIEEPGETISREFKTDVERVQTPEEIQRQVIQPKPVEDVIKRMELGGILVYDSYAKILGCPKI